MEDRNRSGPQRPVSFRLVKEHGSLVLAEGAYKMHANLLEWNDILHIILVYKVVIMFKSNGPCVFHWIPNLTAPQNYLHRF